MSTNNPTYAACPVGMAVFFPWLTEPPNSDWILCDGKDYPKGNYPQLDDLRASLPINRRIDKPAKFITTTKAETDDLILEVSSSHHTNYAADLLFSNNKSNAMGWMAGTAGVPTRQAPVWVNTTLKNNAECRLMGIEMSLGSYGGFPKTFKLLGSAKGETWDLTDEITLAAAPSATSVVYVPVTNHIDPPASRIRLEVYEMFVASYGVSIGRMRLFTKDDDVFTAPKLGENLNKQKGVWCFRVSR